MIASGFPVYDSPVEADGFLFVGDPHVSSVKPGRRKDVDWPGPILAKLEAAVGLANDRRLIPVFTGDMFDSPVEPDESLKTRLIVILKRFWMPPVSNVGNHDIAFTTLSYGDSLAYLGVSDVVDVVMTSGPALTLALGDNLIGLGMTPYGQDIPRDVRGLFPGAAATVWVTHHDIAFSGAYPGAALPFDIEGCGLVVNGHMHKTLPSIPLGKGKTTWANIGNINRQSVDLMDHVPCVWTMEKGGRLSPVELPHVKGVFDLTGRLVSSVAVEAKEPEVESAFVALLEAEGSTELARSQDGSVVLEAIRSKFEAEGTPGPIQATVMSLWTDAVARRRSA